MLFLKLSSLLVFLPNFLKLDFIFHHLLHFFLLPQPHFLYFFLFFFNHAWARLRSNRPHWFIVVSLIFFRGLRSLAGSIATIKQSFSNLEHIANILLSNLFMMLPSQVNDGFGRKIHSLSYFKLFFRNGNQVFSYATWFLHCLHSSRGQVTWFDTACNRFNITIVPRFVVSGHW